VTEDRFGWARSDGCLGLTQAVKALREREARKPTDDDRPSPSTFPMTPAARAALGYGREVEAPTGRHRVVNRDGEIVREPPSNVVPIDAGRRRR
jgi:hypothetical protein